MLNPSVCRSSSIDEADRVIVEVATAVAWTCIRPATDPEMRERFLDGDSA